MFLELFVSNWCSERPLIFSGPLRARSGVAHEILKLVARKRVGNLFIRPRTRRPIGSDFNNDDHRREVKLKGSPISSDLAMSRNLAGENPAQVTASHGRGIQPCSQRGNRRIDA